MAHQFYHPDQDGTAARIRVGGEYIELSRKGGKVVATVQTTDAANVLKLKGWKLVKTKSRSAKK